jgi:hypothetical protein
VHSQKSFLTQFHSIGSSTVANSVVKLTTVVNTAVIDMDSRQNLLCGLVCSQHMLGKLCLRVTVMSLQNYRKNG